MVILFLLLPFILSAAEFTASVNRNPTRMGEGVILSLTLKDGVAKANPSLDVLKENFFVHSQQQSQNTLVINGKVSTSISWQITLVPKEMGDPIIPPLSILTNEGVLSSQAITLHVTEQETQNQEVSIKADLSKERPYKNEPVLFRIELLSRHDLANIQVDKIAIEHALIELINQPKIERKVVDGVKVNTVLFDYLITPLQPGPLNIPPVSIQGDIPVRTRFWGFDDLKPFIVQTDPFHLEVSPPQEEVQPWLPAQTLTITEVIGPPPYQVNEPINRTFEIQAVGVLSTQLPELSKFQSQEVKVYADQPELKDEVVEGKIRAYRKESLTLIPKQEGDLVLPEIQVAFWDVNQNKKAMATVPSRTIHVQGKEKQVEQILPPPAPPTPPEIKDPNPTLYGIIGALAAALLITLIWAITLKLKFSKKEKLRDLNPT